VKKELAMLDLALMSYVGVMSITPGPNNLMLAASGVNFGFRRTVPHMLGISSGHAFQVCVVAAALAFILNWLTAIRVPLALAGCVYLLWLSWQIWRAGEPGGGGNAKPMGLFGAAAFQWLNPKAWVMVINTAILFMPSHGNLLANAALLALLCGLINLPCIGVWALAGDRMRNWLASARGLRIFNGTMAALMAATALWLMIDELMLVL
jgi:threonine/homoserine/homoserine lactone efflux protein